MLAASARCAFAASARCALYLHLVQDVLSQLVQDARCALAASARCASMLLQLVQDVHYIVHVVH